MNIKEKIVYTIYLHQKGFKTIKFFLYFIYLIIAIFSRNPLPLGIILMHSIGVFAFLCLFEVLFLFDVTKIENEEEQKKREKTNDEYWEKWHSESKERGEKDLLKKKELLKLKQYKADVYLLNGEHIIYDNVGDYKINEKETVLYFEEQESLVIINASVIITKNI